MFFWPNLELTEYERRFVSHYKTDVPMLGADGKPLKDKAGKIRMRTLPGVLHRTYKVLLNNIANNNVPGLETIHLTGTVKISRRSRVFGLTFAGDTNLWRLNIETATGEKMTPTLPGNDGPPVVSSMVPGTSWNALASADMAAPTVITVVGPSDVRQIAFNSLPLLIEPNWELLPNESLIFTGTPIPASLATAAILEVAVHIWEFPGMVQGAAGPGPDAARYGAGPSRSC